MQRRAVWGGLLVLLMPLFSNSVSAASSLNNFEPGFYLGAQLGSSLANEDTKVGIDGGVIQRIMEKIPSTKPFAAAVPDNLYFSNGKGRELGRIFLGYSFSPYWGLEAGFSYSEINGGLEVNANIGAGEIKALVEKLGGETDMLDLLIAKQQYGMDINYKHRTYTGDIMLKGVLPLERFYSSLNGWSCYAKAGATVSNIRNRMDSNGIGGVTGVLAGVTDPDIGMYLGIGSIAVDRITNFSDDKTVVRPAYALGLAYNFTEKFALDLSWGGILGAKEKTMHDHLLGTAVGDLTIDYKSRIPFSDYVAMGISYKF